MGGGLRYFGGAVAFGFAAVWIMASLAAAIVCVLAAIVGYAVVSVGERMRARQANRGSSPRAAFPSAPALPRTPEALMPQWADALNSDLGHVYEPTTMSPLSREAEYGWPRTDATLATGGTLQ